MSKIWRREDTWAIKKFNFSNKESCSILSNWQCLGCGLMISWNGSSSWRREDITKWRARGQEVLRRWRAPKLHLLLDCWKEMPPANPATPICKLPQTLEAARLQQQPMQRLHQHRNRDLLINKNCWRWQRWKWPKLHTNQAKISNTSTE